MNKREVRRLTDYGGVVKEKATTRTIVVTFKDGSKLKVLAKFPNMPLAGVTPEEYQGEASRALDEIIDWLKV